MTTETTAAGRAAEAAAPTAAAPRGERQPSLLLVGGAGGMTLSIDVALEALDQARARGLRTHVVNRNDTLDATRAVGQRADAVSAVDFTDAAGTAEWARQTARDTPFDLVFGVREMAQQAVAETAAALGVPGNPPDAVRRVRSKDACRAALTAAGFRQPAVAVCADEQQARAFLARSSGPWVVKPRDGADSAGVRKVTHADELPAALAGLPEPHRSFLVEQFVDGTEYSVEGVFLNGTPHVLAVTAKEKLAPPYFVEIGHVLPAPLADDSRKEIEEQVCAALTALGLRLGLFHVELWLTPDGVVLGEVHARIGGGWIHRMLPHALPGLELYGLVYDDVLGRAPRLPAGPVRAAASRYFAPPPGRLVSVEGWEEVRGHPSVLHAELLVSPGEVIGSYRSGADRVGAVVVGADTPEEAAALARDLVGSVRFVTEPVPAPTGREPDAQVRVTLRSQPLSQSFRISHMTIRSVDIVRLMLTDPDGRVLGEGEIAADLGYGQDGPAIAAEAERLARTLAAQTPPAGPDAVAWLAGRLERAAADGTGAPARMLVEMAFLDRAARTAELPVWQLLSLPEPGRIELLHTVPIGAEIPADGRPLKIKLGGPDDEQILRALTGARGPLILDVNGGWDRAGWQRLRPLVAALAPAVLEDPAREPELVAEIRAALPGTRLVLDEGIDSLRLAERAVRTAGGVNVKLMRFGGLLPALAALTGAAELGGVRMLGCFLEPPRAIAYAAQLAGLCDWTDLDGHFWVAGDPAVGTYRLDSSAPGIPRIRYRDEQAGPAGEREGSRP
ncbi:Biotin carboxylase [Streptomyces sp. 1222.5]|uniref:ATP-grasp domain-containing protein n=1 Tax=unclassified Streptomyces TaxID=2593676 RepID=UPI00089887B3|nr:MULTISPECIES: ATP-grasp domain-containing protein [unclassified Streptomyces]PKW00392.1 biotin carboxylase [Streptomyces sp. 5112.2]SED86905.1 Biotin carboxylase [Streptomyces sp. 1222.5]